MSVIDALLKCAYEDTQLLLSNDEKGDNFETPREVDFIFYCKERTKADTFSSFLKDNQYGDVEIDDVDDKFRIILTLNMPSTQNIICSVSGFATCLAALFDLDYDGWGCVLKQRKQES